jgi:hypothetical protein
MRGSVSLPGWREVGELGACSWTADAFESCRETAKALPGGSARRQLVATCASLLSL